MTPDALLTELKTDPKGLHYAGSTPEHIAALLNTRGLSDETCANVAVSMADLMLAIDPGEWDALEDSRRQLLTTIALKLDTIDFSNTIVQGRFAQLFPADGPTVAALNSLKTRPCTRYEALDAPGSVATVGDVQAAIALNGGVGP